MSDVRHKHTHATAQYVEPGLKQYAQCATCYSIQVRLERIAEYQALLEKARRELAELRAK